MDETKADDLPQDAGIAMILKKLKDIKPPKSHEDNKDDSKDSHDNDDSSKQKSLMVQATDIPVTRLHRTVTLNKEDIKVKDADEAINIENALLPWFLESDKDTDKFHFATLDVSGNLVYNSAESSSNADYIASIKVKDDFACEIDYYKSRHYVLCVKQFESDYSCSNASLRFDEANSNISEVSYNTCNSNDSHLNDTLLSVANREKYWHYLVFTDLGIAEFDVRQDDISFPYGESNLSKWFEVVSNYSVLKNAKYTSNQECVCNNSIKDLKYDIITMQTPGTIILDSIYNDDANYHVKIKLKDTCNFIPLEKIIKCIKYYATHKEKSFEDFNRFINSYFYIIT